jgi:hypothetical protein
MRHAVFAVVILSGSIGSAWAQSGPDSENGRYTMSPTSDGVLRLDTRTGSVSTCTNKGGWVCRSVPDEKAALDLEIGRLQKENDALKSQLAQRGGDRAVKTSEPLAKGDLEKRDGQTTAKTDSKDTVIELRLPPQEELVATIDRLWQHLVDLAGRMQKKFYEKT